MTKITTLQGFKAHIKTLTVTELNTLGDKIENKIHRARNPQFKLGYALFIDEIYYELQGRKYPISDEAATMTDDELLADLYA